MGEATMQIRLTSGDVALCSPEDYQRFSRFRWHLHSNGYAVRYWGKRALYMHRLALSVSSCQYWQRPVDHIDGNRLNNTRENLRVTSYAQNCWNRAKSQNKSSRFKGVHRDDTSRSHPWRACIFFEGRKYNLGRYATEEEAARAYDRAALEFFRHFARLNFENASETEKEAA